MTGNNGTAWFRLGIWKLRGGREKENDTHTHTHTHTQIKREDTETRGNFYEQEMVHHNKMAQKITTCAEIREL